MNDNNNKLVIQEKKFALPNIKIVSLKTYLKFVYEYIYIKGYYIIYYILLNILLIMCLYVDNNHVISILIIILFILI